MKCTIPEISWHNRDPVLSVDIQHNAHDGIYRLATAGTDTHVIIWQLRILDNGGVSVESLSDLTMHNRAVNAVRFSPDGTMLASSDDESSLLIWKKVDQDNAITDIFADDGAKENKENWNVHKILRGHIEDIYDLCWSNCSSYLISGSVDNTAIMWDVSKGKNIGLLNDHKGFVQGVAWDPLGQYVATLSSDRYMRLFHINNKKIYSRAVKAPYPKGLNPPTTEEGEEEKHSRLFYDDTLKSFCRRLSFSPDGELIVAPTGIIENGNGQAKHINGTHIFSRHNPQKPVVFLPTHEKYTIAARFCPMRFELNPIPLENQVISSENEENSSEKWKQYANMFDLPYRMIFAVATQSYVLLYDTQQPMPFAKISNIHYTRLSDISWSEDGLILVVSSTDGYCSLVSFSEEELGKPYESTHLNLSFPTIDSKSSSPKKDLEKTDPIEKKDVEVKGDSIEKMEVDEAPKPIAIKRIEPKPIEVKRMVDGKPVKRVSLVTLSKPASKPEIKPTSESSVTSKVEENIETNCTPETNDKEVEPSTTKDETPSINSVSNDKSPAKSPIKSSIKVKKRISLITLSSPKGKKDDTS